ncbi:MAG: acetate/propionate family kinase [Terriglobales bacterium]
MRVLCINTGSSSLKWALFDGEQAVQQGRTAELASRQQFEAALTAALGQLQPPQAIAHRIVAPNTAWPAPRRIEPGLETELHDLVPLAPDHLPQALAAIQAARSAFACLPQLACSDSSFHRTLPPAARQLALPQAWRQRGLARYGYHGLSCESVLAGLCAEGTLPARILIAHLGNGCSVTAVREGRSVETTMGFSPLSGLVMSTRSGDLDPAILIYLLQECGASATSLRAMLNHESGLSGVSGISGDMQTLLADPHPEAAAAVELFVYTVRKHLGALAAVLGGVDLLVFTGGIGEHAASIRARICTGMDWLAPAGALAVRVAPAREELMMARHAAAALAGPEEET